MKYVCKQCGASFEQPFRKNRPAYFCSRTCTGRNKTQNNAKKRKGIIPPNDLIFSPEDRDLLQLKWHKIKQGYFKTSPYSVETKRSESKFAHQIVSERMFGYAPKRNSGQCIDHINRRKCDNRRENLRIVTVQQNIINQDRIDLANRVVFLRRKGKWQGGYEYKCKHYHVGIFTDKERAIDATLAHRNKTIQMAG